MKEVFVITYYGSVYENMFHSGSWKRQYIGEGILHESDPLTHYPTPADRIVKYHAPKDKEYKYAQIEKRFYPEDK